MEGSQLGGRGSLIRTSQSMQICIDSVALYREKYLILGKEALVLQRLQVALDQTAQVLQRNTLPTT